MWFLMRLVASILMPHVLHVICLSHVASEGLQDWYIWYQPDVVMNMASWLLSSQSKLTNFFLFFRWLREKNDSRAVFSFLEFRANERLPVPPPRRYYAFVGQFQSRLYRRWLKWPFRWKHEVEKTTQVIRSLVTAIERNPMEAKRQRNSMMWCTSCGYRSVYCILYTVCLCCSTLSTKFWQPAMSCHNTM